MELLLGAYFLRKGTPGVTGQAAAALSFAAAAEKRRHKSRVIDNFSDLAEARNAGRWDYPGS
jgi:hypothetical protein